MGREGKGRERKGELDFTPHWQATVCMYVDLPNHELMFVPLRLREPFEPFSMQMLQPIGTFRHFIFIFICIP